VGLGPQTYDVTKRRQHSPATVFPSMSALAARFFVPAFFSASCSGFRVAVARGRRHGRGRDQGLDEARHVAPPFARRPARFQIPTTGQDGPGSTRRAKTDRRAVHHRPLWHEKHLAEFVAAHCAGAASGLHPPTPGRVADIPVGAVPGRPEATRHRSRSSTPTRIRCSC